MIDIVIAVVLIAFTAAGWKHGLIRTLVGLAAMVLAVGLSSQIARAAAPEIVDRYLRPATYAAIEERAQELAKGEEVSSVEDLRRDLSQVLDAIPNDFIREKAQDAVDGLLPQGEALSGALLAPLEELGRDMADRVLDTLVQDVLRSILCAALFVILSAVFRIVARALRIVEKLPGVRQLNELGGALAGLAKGLVLVCLALWVLCHTGVITPEMAEGSVVLGLLPGWIAGTGK
ncbi:MAG: CvpA family protein [Oscillospiraceae bacterium]|nr:CvpA family protein [Oscillospiraceae bacterium]